ncbi:Non-repetitive/WGA-negative nucleoporin C-terminal-domain-containing protein [Myxozyma melibiosi]|uniref:Non-repetitive/WGA-negative nucleoporin C-terminal-domain-containing protein n=1 Tax=Myxozyma melibiosi TaxID=54550 RepID=A0ABR1FB95_9ASCO
MTVSDAGRAQAQSNVPTTPIELAKGYVNTSLDIDSRYPDLDRIIQQSQLSEYFFSPPMTASTAYGNPNPGSDIGPWTPFTRTHISNIPDIIFEQYNKTESYTQMGLFPELQRAWITVDNKLFFWNYMSGEDFLSYEDLQHTILSVQLVKPTAGTFVESIKYLLLLATPLEFFILAVAPPSGGSDIQLFETGMSVPLKGLEVDKIRGSDKTGRIFVTNRGTADIWEITYSNTESWFRGKCSKVCHTKGGLSGFAPSVADVSKFVPTGVMNALFSSSKAESIVAIEIDDSRSLVYTLSSRSTIRAYHMSSPTDLTLVITYTYASLCSHLQMINAASPLLDPRSTAIVSIEPIRPIESTQIHLIATTSTGCRLYLRAARLYGFEFSSNQSAPPTNMQVIQVRFPPRESSAQAPSVSRALQNTRFSKIFSPGYYFAVKEGESGDSVFVSAPDTGRILLQSLTSNSAPQLVETSAWADIEGFVQEIALLSAPFQVAPKPEGFGNEVAAQYTLPPTQVAILTNTGVHIYTRRYMVQTFAMLGNHARMFLEMYGRSETCCTALSVACATTGPTGAVPLDAREIARKAYIEFGGKAHLRDDNYGVTMISLDSVRLSGRFEGLSMYMARIVRDIWKVPIIKQIKSRDGKSFSYATNVSVDKLNAHHAVLYDLYQFLEQNQSYIDGLSGPDRVLGALGSNNARIDELSLQAEHRGMHALMTLLRHMTEGLSFVSMIVEPRKLSEIMMNVSGESQQRIIKLSFEDLFTSDSGTELANELVRAMVNVSISSGSSVDSVIDVLRKRCGSFCSSDAVVLYKSLELLNKARVAAATDPDLKMHCLTESVHLLGMAAGTIVFEELQNAISIFLSLDYHPGAIQVALKAATEVDRGNQAVSYFADGKPASDPREAIFAKREKCYQLVFSILDDVDARVNNDVASLQRDQQLSPGGNTVVSAPETRYTQLQLETYGIAYDSRDELFHYFFYDWFMERGLSGRLLDIDTPYIEQYLQRNALLNLEIADLLWTFYCKKEEFLAASEVLYRLSRSDFDLPLSQRIEYLSRARGFCNCYGPPGQRQAMLRLGQRTQDELEVAYIQDDLLNAVKEDDRLKGDEQRRAALIDKLDGLVLDLTTLYNEFASPLAYQEICEAIVKAAS